MRIEVVKEKTFEPMYGGNLDLPASERVRVFHRFLTPGERNKYIYTKPIKIGAGQDGSMEFVQDEEGITRAIITKIENLEISFNDKPIKITTAKALYDTEGVPADLVREIELYCFTASPEVGKPPFA
jgi:hypothetical protein